MSKTETSNLEAEVEYWRLESVRAAMAGRMEEVVKARVQFHRARNLLGLLVTTQQLGLR